VPRSRFKMMLRTPKPLLNCWLKNNFIPFCDYFTIYWFITFYDCYSILILAQLLVEEQCYSILR
jgi:hypothetical protein